MSRLSLIPVLAIAALITTHTGESLAGKVYRWVDADGQVHFGSQPPPEQRTEAEQYHVQVQQPSSTPPRVLNTDQASATQDESEEEQIEENSGKGAVSAEQAKEYCQKAKDFMLAMQGSHSKRFKQDDGSYRPFSEEERKAKQQKAQEIMEQFCTLKK